NGYNNDANIMKHMTTGSTPLNEFIQHEDLFILDRGFRDSIAHLEEIGVDSLMPNLLKPKQKQFAYDEGNSSRKVTMVRWLVEAVNGRLKNKFKFLDGVIPNSYIPNLMNYFRVACALCNAFCAPLKVDSEENEQLIDLALQKTTIPNHLKQEIEAENLRNRRNPWIEASSENI